MSKLNMEKVENLKKKVDCINRIKLADLPTPLVELKNFSKVLGGPKIYMKRDDIVGGDSFGGNKTRMLEYRLAPAVEQKADVIVSGFAIQSNHARQIAIAAKKLGMDVKLILRRISPNEKIEIQGNLLIDFLVGAQIEIINCAVDEQIKYIQDEIKKLENEGRHPYETGFNDEDLSAISYVNCSLELLDQVYKFNIQPTHIYVASEGATQAGLVLFSKYVESTYKVIGINMVDWVPDVRYRISSISNAAARRLEIDCYIKPEEVINDNNYIGKAYGIPTPECIQAIKLLARTEGIFSDPVYVGKGLAGLIDHIKKGKLNKNDSVIFLHTGGAPLLFCYSDIFNFNIK